MRILLVMDPGIPVPPKGYGGIERIVALMAKEYLNQGHSVDLLASEGSYIKGCSLFVIGKEGFPPAKSEMNKAIRVAWGFIWKNRNKYDLIHNFGRLLYLLPVLHHPIKKIMCYQREITSRNINIFNKLPNKNIVYCGCSNDLIKRAGVKGRWKVVYNAVNFDEFQLTEQLPGDSPLIFLGRIERIKGCHTAINVAKATGNKLIIAGNISRLREEREYFENEIKPLVDGCQIIYVGEVNDEQKNDWLGKSKAMLMPIEWNEPFGIVMIEAMACGTPVIGYKKGSIPEVVEENKTGFVVMNENEMIAAVKKINVINRTGCRETAKAKFNSDVVAHEYLNIFSN